LKTKRKDGHVLSVVGYCASTNLNAFIVSTYGGRSAQTKAQQRAEADRPKDQQFPEPLLVCSPKQSSEEQPGELKL